ncbi:ASKHA domain-containing protein [Desulfovibrio legallii]|uniref:DUF4445 domain-containing protein n=1 Tax=Desulfovibrio legallii TaxID=571438 RepID=A0A1G7PDP8_9BACT|nr:ASKHA domain-containing protein [Desulfovibrio legallii]SDF84277.1 protein of unknown function [Desulfovibrio legallii]
MLLRLFPTAAASAPASPAEAVSRATVQAAPGAVLSRAVWLSGLVPPQPLCGGLGRCGRCRVRFCRAAPPPLPAEVETFTPQELAAGWRLACRRTVPETGDYLDLELPEEDFYAFGAAGATGSSASGTAVTPADGAPLALAVDLGTTSLYWRAVTPEGEVAAQGHGLNPQAGAGADVMSRLAVAREPEGRRVLAELVRQELRAVTARLEARGAGRVRRVCLAANPAMTAIFLDRDVSGLCTAPYRLDFAGDAVADVPGLPPVYVPPQPAPFVGGDASAGLAALLARHAPRPFVLADMGTNGEMALMTDAGLWLTSVPLGPALEGIGPECGQQAGPGVVTGFALTPQGLTARFFADPAARAAGAAHSAACPCPACAGPQPGQDRRARGISATGYLSLLAALLRAGLLRPDGRLDPAPAMPLARRVAAGLEGGRLRLPHGLRLCPADVEELLKVKAAFALALAALLRAGGVPVAGLARLYLAGSLGVHVGLDDLETLGFLPAGLATRTRAAGNTALEGAALLALRPARGRGLARICRAAHVLALTEQPDFAQDYLRQMRFGG